MRILFVCLDRFPHEGACTSLLINMLLQQAMQDLGEIHVLTVGSNLVSNQLEENEVIDGIHIHRFYSLCHINTKSLFCLKNERLILRVREILYRVLNKIHVSYTRKHFYNTILLEEVKKHLNKLMNDNRFDIVIPMSGNYVAAVATLELCKKYNTELIFYQVDPCSTNQVMDPITIAERQVFEKDIIEYSKFTITTKIIKCEMQQLLTRDLLDKLKIMEFPNVNVKPYQKDSYKNADGKIHCLFAGTLYQGARDPNFAVNIFSKISNKKIVFDIVGVDKNGLMRFTGRNLPEHIVCHGRLSLHDSKKAIQNANILVNIGNIVANQVPSKLFEYISTGKPIINFCATNTCPSIYYMQKYPLALNLTNNLGDEEFEIAAKQLEDFIINNATKRLSPEYIKREFYECTPEYCAKYLADLIQR